jgi:hypothetical protein
MTYPLNASLNTKLLLGLERSGKARLIRRLMIGTAVSYRPNASWAESIYAV